MKTYLLIPFILIALSFTQITLAQTAKGNRVNTNKNYFDETAAISEAKNKGLRASEINGYVRYLKNDFSSKKALEQSAHKHTPYELGNLGINETVIYLEPNKPMSVDCANMGFEQYNFSGWTGGVGTTVSGSVGGNPNYLAIGSSINNIAGNNVSPLNTLNYHTIMSVPPIDPNYLSINGYDSIACKSVGTQTISEIPFVSPYSFDNVSVRMNGVISNNRACRLKYITTSSPSNQRLSFSYAVVFENPADHATEESPYFKVEVKNEATGLVLPGCTSYTFNPKSLLPSDSLKLSALDNGLDSIYYRKWQYYTVDLSTLPSGTNVSINFEVGACTLGGHWGYAYVDAECGGVGVPFVNMCSGSTIATLVAPEGFNTYQWSDASGVILGATNDTLVVNAATVGSTYLVSMVTAGGCSLTQSVSIASTSVTITNVNATSSCVGGNSGTGYVQVSGGDGNYTYSWTSTSGATLGNIVSTSQTAVGLSSGTYSVLVSTQACGQATANITIGISPPSFIALNKVFCGDTAFIVSPVGSNYIWYKGTTVLPSINDTLYISSPNASDIYTLVYINTYGCKDSIAYNLNRIAGSNIFLSNIQNVCPSNANGSAVVNLSTSFPAPYSYLVTGSSGIVSNVTSSVNTLSLSALSAGSYTAIVYDGVCIYDTQFDINVIQTSFTITPTNTVLCFPTDTAKLKLDFGNQVPMCGYSSLCSNGAPITLFSTGTFTQNSSVNYPTPYGNFHTYAKHQFIVRKAELNSAGITAGKISSLAFNVLNLNWSITNYPNFEIKMGCTSLTNLPTAPTAFVSGLQTVYTNPNQPITLGWLTHNFNQSYIWDGVSNIIIEVCFGMNSPSNFSENVSIELKQMPYVASMFFREDLNPVCGGTQLANNASPMVNGINMLPNMKFGYCPYATPPANYTVSVSSNGTMTDNYGNDSMTVIPTFTAPPLSNTPVVYTITIINPEGLCTTTQTVSVLYPSLNASITATPTNTTLCAGETINLFAAGAENYNWTTLQGGLPVSIATTASITITPPLIGMNTYMVEGSTSCSSNLPDTKTVTVNVIPVTNLSIIPLEDVTVCLDELTILSPTIQSTPINATGVTYNYSWIALPSGSPAPGVNTAPSYTALSNEGLTTLIVTVNGMCSNTVFDTVNVTVLPPCTIIIPNVITSNGDGVNDYFKIKNIEYHPNTHVAIFNRWGLNIFDNPNYANEWKADGVSDGTYFYVIDVPDDKKYSGFITVFKGK